MLVQARGELCVKETGLLFVPGDVPPCVWSVGSCWVAEQNKGSARCAFAGAHPTVSSKVESVGVTSGTNGLGITSVIFKSTFNIGLTLSF